MTEHLDLGSLPAPNIIQSLDYEQIVAQIKQLLIDKNQDYADALTLASDPLTIAIEAFAYRELLLRQHINQVVRANLLAFATDNDLDQLGAFYGVIRQQNENDSNLRLRIKDRILGSSTAGGEAHYRYQAFSVSTDIRDISVDSPNPGQVRVSVLAKTDADINQLIELVKARVTAPDVQVLTDTVAVVPTDLVEVDIIADITPQTGGLPVDKLIMEENFMEVLEEHRRLGWDLAPSWIISQLHGSNIQQVELIEPSHNIDIAPNQCVVVRSIQLNILAPSA